MINLRSIGIIAVIAAIIAWNSISTTIAYRTGRNAAAVKELATLRATLVEAIDRYQESIHRYDQLAIDYATATASEKRQIIKMEQTIRDHVKKNRGTCRIDARSLQLINALVAAANQDYSRAAGGNERAGTVPDNRDIKW